MIDSTDCILIMGRRKCGKSHLAKKVQEMWPRRVIIDSLGEYSGENIVKSFSKFCEKLIYFKENKVEKFILIYQFDPEDKVSDELFDEILRVCFYFGNIQIVIEEVQEYSTTQKIPHWLKKCLHVGRHKKLSLLFTTQRPGALHKTILSQCAHIFCGNIVEGNDLRYVSSFLNEDAKRLATLPERRFLYFSGDKITEISNNL
jgi:DNA helicase HerA-like ATPase